MIGMSQFNDFSLLKGLYILCKWLMQLLHFHFKNQNRSLKGTGAKCDVFPGSWGGEYLGKVSDYLGGVGDYGCVPPKSKNCINKPLFCAQKEKILRSRVCGLPMHCPSFSLSLHAPLVTRAFHVAAVLLRNTSAVRRHRCPSSDVISRRRFSSSIQFIAPVGIRRPLLFKACGLAPSVHFFLGGGHGP